MEAVVFVRVLDLQGVIRLSGPDQATPLYLPSTLSSSQDGAPPPASLVGFSHDIPSLTLTSVFGEVELTLTSAPFCCRIFPTILLDSHHLSSAIKWL